MNYDLEMISPPSETILRRLSELEIELNYLMNYLDLELEDFAKFIHDQLEVTRDIALKLSQVLGGSDIFWINRYRNFLDDSKLMNQKVYADFKSTVDNLCSSRETDLENLLGDFQYSTLEHLVVDYFESPRILYSKTQKFEPSPVELANWIRACEREAELEIYRGKVKRFSRHELELALPALVSLTKINNTERILSKIVDLCYGCGIVILFKPSKSGFGVSGFTKRILKNYRLIVVTDRYKNNAAFWFTLFHEISHCLLHNLEFPLIHYSDDEFQLASLEVDNLKEEAEANQMVESLFFPDKIKDAINRCESYKDIISLAVNFDISAALIVAQIHRRRLKPHSWFRKIFRKVDFSELH